MTRCQVYLNGITGCLASTGGFVMTCLEQVDAWLRVGCSGLGFTIGAITLYRLLTRKHQ